MQNARTLFEKVELVEVALLLGLREHLRRVAARAQRRRDRFELRQLARLLRRDGAAKQCLNKGRKTASALANK